MAAEASEGTERNGREKDVEMDALKRIVALLRALPSHGMRTRVIGYISARLEDEGRIERGEPPRA